MFIQRMHFYVYCMFVNTISNNISRSSRECSALDSHQEFPFFFTVISYTVLILGPWIGKKYECLLLLLFFWCEKYAKMIWMEWWNKAMCKTRKRIKTGHFRVRKTLSFKWVYVKNLSWLVITSFICMRIKIYFVINTFVLSLASKQRLRATQSEMVYSYYY